MTRWLSLWKTGLALVALESVASAATFFHVAPPPLGNDAAPGTADAPFASLDRARQAVRARLAAGPDEGGIVVTLHGGLYELSAPVRFQAEDSGRPGSPVVYRAAPGQDVVLSGGRPVTGWRLESSGVYRADVGREVDFRQLWVGGRRAVRARTPNEGRFFKLIAEKQEDGLDLAADALAGVTVRPQEIECVVLIAWMHKRLRIAQVRPTENGLRAVIAAPEWDAVLHQPQGDRLYLNRDYWLENAREFLDAPGEFHLDRDAGVLRYRPRPGENVPLAGVTRPLLESLIVLEGRPEAPVRHLRFEGLTFAHTGWTRPNTYGFVDVQANSLVPADPAGAVDPRYRHDQRKDRIPAAFQAETADHVVLRGNRFARLGGTGVMFRHGGDDNVISQNSFYDIAGGGIEVGEDAHRPTDARYFPRRNEVANNFISHIGEDYYGSVAILGYYTDAFVIRNNTLANLPYTAISQGWGWGQPIGPPDARDNRILRNRVTNYLRRLDDGGGLYTTDRQLGSEIAYNLVERMLPPHAATRAGGAIYPDQFSEGFHIHHNVVTEAVRWLNIWNPNIRHNRVDTHFADTASWRNDGSDNDVEQAEVVPPASPWPEAARAIRDGAGLEPDVASTLHIDAPAEVISTTAGVEFQIVSGEWSVLDGIPGGYGATFRQSTCPDARARWMPIVPRTGTYEVAVRSWSGAAPADYVVRHADGETRVTRPAALSENPAWVVLGRFRFQAGTGAEVDVAPTQDSHGHPLILDALRLQPSP